MFGAFTERPAVETPDGINRVFNAPTAWTGTLYVAINQIVLWRGFSFIGGTQIQFDTAPSVGDVIAFFYNPP